VSVIEHDFPETVAADLIENALDQLEKQSWLERDSAGNTPGLEDLAETEGWDYHRRLPLRCEAGDLMRVQVVSAQRKMLPVLLDDAQGDDAHPDLLRSRLNSAAVSSSHCILSSSDERLV